MIQLRRDLESTLVDFKPTSEHKVLRDPVHGYINVYHQVIWDLIATPEFQRLRRIHQLGGTTQVYHTAEHSRFGHSLGVYEIVRLMLDNVKNLRESLSEFEQIAVLCAGLLHDIGHGPFSHAFETITNINHEVITDRIILENTQVHHVLKMAHPDLPKVVADIIAHRHERKLLTQMISSQMDADRMDYLLRDSYFTGVSYGEFDLHRILRTIRIVNDTIVMKESGIHAVEDYIMARYQMYWQVYLHPVSRSYESLLFSVFKRMRDVQHSVLKGAEDLVPFLTENGFTLEDFNNLTESTVLSALSKLKSSPDPILADLSRRILNRDLLDYQDIKSDETVNHITQKVIEAGFDPDYYVLKDYMTQILYKPYSAKNAGLSVLKEDGTVVELSNASMIVRGFVQGEEKEDRKVFFPKEIKRGIHE